MSTPVIFGLADRGREAASVMVERYNTPQFPLGGERRTKHFTAWDNHRWLRYSALLGALPEFLEGFAAGRKAFQLNPAEQNSWALSEADQRFAEDLYSKLDEAATLLKTNPAARERLTRFGPAPRAILRRVPQI
jgi:hypothetical protein